MSAFPLKCESIFSDSPCGNSLCLKQGDILHAVNLFQVSWPASQKYLCFYTNPDIMRVEVAHR